MGLGDADGRRSVATVLDRLARAERQLAYLRSTATLLRRGDFAPGTIPDTALAQPAAPGVVSARATGFGLTTAPTAVLATTVTVPPRMRRCVLSATGRVYARNSTSSTDHFLARIRVPQHQTEGSNAVPVRCAAGDHGLNIAVSALLLTGLEPGTGFTVEVLAMTSTAAWSADASHLADLSGSLGWSA